MRRVILSAVFIAMIVRVYRLNRTCESLFNALLQAKWDATPDFMGVKRFIENK